RGAEQILVPVQRLELGEAVALLHLVTAGAGVVPLQALQRRARQRLPVGHAASSLSADSSACAQRAIASAPVDSSGAWLTHPASGARRSANSSARPGIVLVAPGSATSRPMVATAPGIERAISWAASTNRAAAPSASERSDIGTVPAWPRLPEKTTSKPAMPAIEVTTPSGAPAEASAGPCSMWVSRKQAGGGSAQPLVGSRPRPSSAKACATEAPSASRR